MGDATASTTAAVLLSILQESLGRVTTIMFAHRLGTSLEPECKMYRLLADIFNDSAMILECLSPAFAKPMRVSILATSSALKALCGVAAGSSKASLSAHFARWGNLGELNAKDSSQETIISLFGMLAGSAVVSMVTTPAATWSTLILLLSVHLAMNYRAVRAVSMRSLNRQRASIVFGQLLARDKLLTPAEVAQKERIFEMDGVVRNDMDTIMGSVRIGVSFGELIDRLGDPTGHTTRKEWEGFGSDYLDTLMNIFKADKAEYIVWLDSRERRCWIVLRQNCSVIGQLKAWYTAYVALKELSTANGGIGMSTTDICGSRKATFDLLEASQAKTQQDFPDIKHRLQEAGWDLDTAALETHSGYRIQQTSV